jgi:energy-coupling factor transport system substrate-specific component
MENSNRLDPNKLDSNRLKAKDLITTAIFTVVFYAVYIGVGSILWMTIVLNPFCVAVAMIPCAIVWAYMRAKVPKRFAILIQGTLLAGIAFLLGSPWSVAAGFFIGGLLAEILSGIGRYGSLKWTTIGFAAFAVMLNLGNYALIVFARDYYYDICMSSGFEPELANTLINAVSGPILLLTCALAAVGAVVGMFIGKAALKKHFERAGIV